MNATNPWVLRSPLLTRAGFRHGFSTRNGGLSEGPFASLNLGASVGDDPDRVRVNHHRFAVAIGYEPGALHQTSQVHGAAVHRVGAGDDPGLSPRVEADALVARSEGVAVGVRVADCVPVLIADTVTGDVAAVHAGWKGVVAGVVARAVETLGAGDPSKLIAAAGPCIGPCCFEVGDDVAESIAGASNGRVVNHRPGQRPTVDLWAAVEHQLGALGVEGFERVGECTACHPGHYFSFRRDGQRSGRMIGAVMATTHPRPGRFG